MTRLETPTRRTTPCRAERQPKSLQRFPPLVVVAEQRDSMERPRAARIAAESNRQAAPCSRPARRRGGAEVWVLETQAMVLEQVAAPRLGVERTEDSVECRL